MSEQDMSISEFNTNLDDVEGNAVGAIALLIESLGNFDEMAALVREAADEIEEHRRWFENQQHSLEEGRPRRTSFSGGLGLPQHSSYKPASHLGYGKNNTVDRSMLPKDQSSIEDEEAFFSSPEEILLLLETEYTHFSNQLEETYHQALYGGGDKENVKVELYPARDAAIKEAQKHISAPRDESIKMMEKTGDGILGRIRTAVEDTVGGMMGWIVSAVLGSLGDSWFYTYYNK